MKTIAKTLKVLKCFTPEHEEWGVTELGRATGIHKVIVHRVLRSLAAERFVVQDPKNRRYRLGGGLIELARNSLRNVNVAEVARPHLEKLRNDTKETVLLSIRRGLSILVVGAYESPQTIRVTGVVGDQAPMHCSAAGKLFLSFGPPAVLEELLAHRLKTYTPKSLTHAAALKEELARVHKRGWAVDDEESVPGIRAVAAPVTRNDGGIEACIAVRGPAARLPRSSLRRLAARVMVVANTVSAEMQQREKS